MSRPDLSRLRSPEPQPAFCTELPTYLLHIGMNLHDEARVREMRDANVVVAVLHYLQAARDDLKQIQEQIDIMRCLVPRAMTRDNEAFRSRPQSHIFFARQDCCKLIEALQEELGKLLEETSIRRMSESLDDDDDQGEDESDDDQGEAAADWKKGMVDILRGDDDDQE